MIKYDPEKHNRHSIRLKGYDYATAGCYFVTITIQNRECLLGNVDDLFNMKINDFGVIVNDTWCALPSHYHHVEISDFVIMPNHIHGIIMIDKNRAGLKPAPTEHGLFEVVRAFKTFSARLINKARNTPGIKVWQRNYYEHIIRNDEEYYLIHEYIKYNPVNWAVKRNRKLQGWGSVLVDD